MGHVQARNAVDPAGSDLASGPGTEGLEVPPVTREQALMFSALKRTRLLQALTDTAFDYTHPVDEYAPQGGVAVITNQVVVQPDYDMPERISNIMVILSVGCTGATLQLGQRTYQLYSGSALSSPGILSLNVHGIIVNADDPRILTMTGALSTAPHLGLTGFALTRGQFS